MSTIITSVMPFDYTIDEGSSGKMKLKGIFQRANAKNENNRIYPKRILEREVSSLQEMINERRLLGELGHPQTAEINLERVCQLVTNLMMKNDDVMGEAEVVKGTPYGSILEALLKNDVKLGISSRGKGTTRNYNGVDEVNEDYKMITFDIVSKPSTPGAFPQAMVESSGEDKKIIDISTLIDKVLNNEMTEKEVIEALNYKPGKRKYFI